MAYHCRNDRNSFTMTPIESWSITKRRRIKCLLSCMTEWSMNYQDFCRLLQQLLGPMVSWPTEQRGKINGLLSLSTEWNINYPDFCGLFQELIAHKVAPQILLDAVNESDIDGELKEEEPSVHTTQDVDNYKANKCEEEKEEEDDDELEVIGIDFVNNNEHNVPLVAQEAIDEDCKSEDSEPDFEPDADLLGSIIQDVDHGAMAKQISNQYTNDGAIAAQCQQLDVNNENNILTKKNLASDSSIVQQQLNDEENVDEEDKKNDEQYKQLIECTILKEHILFNEMEASSPYPEASRSSVPMVQDEETKQESIPSHASSVPITSNLSGNAAVNSSSNKSKLNRDAPIFTPQSQLPSASSMLSAASDMLQASFCVNNKFIVTNCKPNINAAEQNNDIQSTPNQPPALLPSFTFNINANKPQNRPSPNQINPMQHIDTPYNQRQQRKKLENENKIDVNGNNNDQQKTIASKPNHSEFNDDYIEEDEQKNDYDMKPIICRQWTSSQPQGLHFQPKHRNHAKGNFYVSEIMKWKIAAKAKVKFYTVDANQDDVALLLYYIKESSAMQINDGQIRVIYGRDKKARIVIDIDLQFRDGQKMYLIAERQKEEDRKLYGVDWQIVEMMTAKQLGDIGIDVLPQSSRDRNWYKRALSYSPHNMSKAEIVDMLNRTNFRSKRFRKSKRNNNENKRMQIKERLLKSCCEKALHNKVSMPFPVVVIKNEKHWIEWKQIVGVYDKKTRENGWIAISLRYYEMKQEWKLEMIDDDGGVIYYKHRLVSLSADEYSYTYNELRKVNTSLDIL